MLLVQGHLALQTQHDFIANRVHFPALPILGEGEHADQPASRTIRTGASGIILKPAFVLELWLCEGAPDSIEMNWEAKQVQALQQFLPVWGEGSNLREITLGRSRVQCPLPPKSDIRLRSFFPAKLTLDRQYDR